MAFNFVTKAMLGPLVPLYSLSLGVSLATVGMLVSLSYVLPLLFAMPLGSLVDRWGPRRPTIFATSLMGLAPLVVVLWPGLASLAVAQVLSGLAHMVAGISSQSFLATLGTGRERERNFGWYATFTSGGQLVGPLLAGVLVDTAGFAAAYGAAAGVSAIAAVLAYLLNPASNGAMATKSFVVGFAGGLRNIGQFLAKPGVRMGIGISSSAMCAMAAYQAFFPAYLEGLAYSATAIGAFLSFKSAVSMVVRTFMPKIIAAFGGRDRTQLAMVAFIAAGVGMAGFVTSIPLLGLACLLFGIGFGVTQPLSMVSVLEEVPADQRGFVLGLRLSGNRLAQLLSPSLLGVVAHAAGFGLTFLSGGALALLISLPLAVEWRRRDALVGEEPGPGA